LRYKRFPEGLFSGSEATMRQLREAIASAPGSEP
jgi:hypothetical protein